MGRRPANAAPTAIPEKPDSCDTKLGVSMGILWRVEYTYGNWSIDNTLIAVLVEQSFRYLS